MKYIKLFEQYFEDDPFGEESIYSIYGDRFRIILGGDGNLYLAEKIEDGKVWLYRNSEKALDIKKYGIDLNPNIRKISIIKWWHQSQMLNMPGSEWKQTMYLQLPPSIKNRLMDDQRNIS